MTASRNRARPALARLGRYLNSAPGYARAGEATHLYLNATAERAVRALLAHEYLLWPASGPPDGTAEPYYLSRDEVLAVPLLAEVDRLLAERQPRRQLWAITWPDQTTVLYQAPKSRRQLPPWFVDLMYALAQGAPCKPNSTRPLHA